MMRGAVGLGKLFSRMAQFFWAGHQSTYWKITFFWWDLSFADLLDLGRVENEILVTVSIFGVYFMGADFFSFGDALVRFLHNSMTN